MPKKQYDSPKKMAKDAYRESLHDAQVQLVRLQRHLIAQDLKILILFEGRDSAGKDGTIKRITQHLSPRETRVVALGKPSDRERTAWYFQRWVRYLPTAQEMVLMNRSWYNRAGVERVMGFCNDAEYEDFMHSVLAFEHLIADSGIILLKYYLDISKKEQRKRLADRRSDPLKQWKISPIDAVALKKWNGYSTARDDMLQRTHNGLAPWYIVRADDKRSARVNVIRHILSHVDCPDTDVGTEKPDPDIVAAYDMSMHTSGFLAP
jgi:polyphosphate kinase 2